MTANGAADGSTGRTQGGLTSRGAARGPLAIDRAFMRKASATSPLTSVGSLAKNGEPTPRPARSSRARPISEGFRPESQSLPLSGKHPGAVHASWIACLICSAWHAPALDFFITPEGAFA